MAPTEEKKKVYDYFDTPDGEDIPEKLWCVLKPTLPTAAGLGIADVMLWSYPKGYLATAVRFAAVSLPVVGIASTFVLATNGIASLRKKDDRLNWFLGGFMAGSCFGLLCRNKMIGFNMGMLFGISGFLRKEMAQQGWYMVPRDAKHRPGGATYCLRDYSLTPELPRNWTDGKS